MEGNDQQTKADEQPNNTPTPPESATEQEETTDRNKNRYTEIGEWLQRNHKNASLVINFLLMIGTGLLFWKASSQSESAQIAADAARDAVIQYKQANKTSDSNYGLAKIVFDSTEKDNGRRYKMDSQSSEEQIAAMKNTMAESKRQFLLDNAPTLAVSNANMVKFSVGSPYEFNFTLLNLGKYPVKMYSCKRWVTYDFTTPSHQQILDSFAKNRFEENNLAIYIAKEIPFTGAFTSGQIVVNSADSAKIAMGLKIFFYGEYRYVNPLTNGKVAYRFCVRVFTPPQNGVMETYYSDNIIIK